MYSVGDKIVHPLHGAGTVESITTRSVGGKTLEYYILKLPANNMTVMVPTASSDEIGIRDVIDADRADELLASFDSVEIENDSNWNKRFRENTARIKSGNLKEVICVIKSLSYRELKNGLSTGERKMLHSAKQIIISELIFAKNSSYSEIEQQLDLIISNSLK